MPARERTLLAVAKQDPFINNRINTFNTGVKGGCGGKEMCINLRVASLSYLCGRFFR